VLGARSVSAFALALHELATNASKYGALSTADGTIAIAWTLEEGAEGPILRFHWSEQGGPPVRKPERRGFGTRIIEGALSAEINGTASIDFQSGGIAFEAVAPLKDLTEDA